MTAVGIAALTLLAVTGAGPAPVPATAHAAVSVKPCDWHWKQGTHVQLPGQPAGGRG